MALVEQGQQLLAAPAWVVPSGLENRRHDLLARLIRRSLWPARPLLQPGRALAQVPVDPLVPGLARDPVHLAQLGDRQHIAKVIGDELRPLVHR